jgi:hypothetical protein
MTDRSDPAPPDGRVVHGDPHDTLHIDDPALAAWLRRILQPSAFQGDAVVLPREAMESLIGMCRRRGFVISARDG